MSTELTPHFLWNCLMLRACKQFVHSYTVSSDELFFITFSNTIIIDSVSHVGCDETQTQFQKNYKSTFFFLAFLACIHCLIESTLSLVCGLCGYLKKKNNNTITAVAKQKSKEICQSCWPISIPILNQTTQL